MDYDRNTIIWAPRRSGKTEALLSKFVNTQNSILMTPYRTGWIKSHLESWGWDERKRDVFRMSSNEILGKRADYIFIDEIDLYQDDIGDFFRRILPVANRIVAVSTPNCRHTRSYDIWFHNNINLAHELKTGKFDHFKGQEDLFSV